MFLKNKNDQEGCLPLPQGYIHVWPLFFDHFLLCNRSANQSQILCGASLRRVAYTYKNDLGYIHNQDYNHARIW